MKPNSFCFLPFLEELKGKIALSEQERISHEIKSFQCEKRNIQKQTYTIGMEEEALTKREQSYLCSFETEQFFLFAVCSNYSAQSQVVLEMVRKNSPRVDKKTLKKLPLIITTIKFIQDQQEILTLVCGTKCGRFLTYRHFDCSELLIESKQISGNMLIYMKQLGSYNMVFVVSDIGTIYAVNFVLKQVLYQFRCSLPLIQDLQQKIIIDLSTSFIGHVFSYGRIIIWELTKEMKEKMYFYSRQQTKVNLSSQQTVIDIDNATQAKYSKESKILKQMILRYKMSIGPTFSQGIVWADFLGIFIVCIDEIGKLRILAVNFNEQNENYEFYSEISSMQICKDTITNNFKGIIERQFVSSARKHGQNSIIIGKNIQKTNYKKVITSCCQLQKYIWNNQFKIDKIIVVSLTTAQMIQQFEISQGVETIVIRDSFSYCLIRNKRRVLNQKNA